VLVKLGDSVTDGQALLTVVGPHVGEAVAALRGSEATLLESQAALQQNRAQETEAQAALIQARAGLSKANTAKRKAQADYQRVLDLFQHNAVAQKELLNAETDLRQATADILTAEAGIKQAEAGIAQARAGVSQAQAGIQQVGATVEPARLRLRLLGISGDANSPVVVHSPLSGKVLEIRVVAGEYHSDTGAPVMIIADLRSVWVTSNVPESSIRLIGLGEPVRILLDAYPGQTFNGRVTHIADVLDPRTRTLKVAIELDNHQGKFRPEMFGRIQHIQAEKMMPVVPGAAVIQSDAGSFVYIERSQGRFERRDVVTGPRAEGRIALVKGVKMGERVVADGAILLRQ
jgi:cobalt-zinc-cadmium efflux system membrane fusion protein